MRCLLNYGVTFLQQFLQCRRFVLSTFCYENHVNVDARDRREYRYRIETSDTKASSISIGISSGLSEVSVSVSVSVQGFLQSRYQSRYRIIDFSTKLQGNFMPLCSKSIGISINIGDLTGISINISISLGICKVSVSVSIQGYPKYQYQSRYQLRAAQSISISIVSKNLVPSVSDSYKQ